MTDAAATWTLSRSRFVDSLAGLSAAQLNWRLQPEVMTIGEMALHVAGVEVSFSSQLSGAELSDDLLRLKSAATDGTINDKPFPYAVEEITPELVAWALAEGAKRAEEILDNPDPYRAAHVQSALGPMIDGTGVIVRFGFHPAYHHGQVYIIRNAPGFPE